MNETHDVMCQIKREATPNAILTAVHQTPNSLGVENSELHTWRTACGEREYQKNRGGINGIESVGQETVAFETLPDHIQRLQSKVKESTTHAGLKEYLFPSSPQ